MAFTENFFNRQFKTSDYRFLTNIWAIRLFSRYCDICKDFRFEIPAIYSRYMHSALQKKCALKMIILSFAALFSSQYFYIFLMLKKTLELVNF